LNTGEKSASENEVQKRLGKVHLGKSNVRERGTGLLHCYKVLHGVQNRNVICQLAITKHLRSGHPVSSSMLPREVCLLDGAESVAGDQCGIKHPFEQDCNAVTLIQSTAVFYKALCQLRSSFSAVKGFIYENLKF